MGCLLTCRYPNALHTLTMYLPSAVHQQSCVRQSWTITHLETSPMINTKLLHSREF